MSSYTRLKPEALLSAEATMQAALSEGGKGNPFGISDLQVAALTSGGTGLNGAILAQKAAIVAERQATQQKAVSRKGLVDALSSAAATAYASTATDTQLASLGLPPRRTGTSRPKASVQPTALLAVPNANGTVKLSWARGDNRYGMTFLLETSGDGVEWSFLRSTQRVSETVAGFAPGTAAWFRVTAATSTTTSLPSAPVAVYAPASAPVQLRLAA